MVVGFGFFCMNDESVGSLGIMIYGYPKDDGVAIQKQVSRIVDQSVMLLSASGHEKELVEDVLTQDGSVDFKEESPKVLMFLGFSNEEISCVVDGFDGSGVDRPIFCCLTEENCGWSIQQLLEHLVEEHRYWQNQEKK